MQENKGVVFFSSEAQCTGTLEKIHLSRCCTVHRANELGLDFI